MSFEDKLNKSKENKNTPKKAIDSLMPTDQEEQTPTKSTESENDFLERMNKRKKTIDTHTRHTFLIRKDLMDRLNKLSEIEGRGFMKEFIDYAAEEFLKEFEDDILNKNSN